MNKKYEIVKTIEGLDTTRYKIYSVYRFIPNKLLETEYSEEDAQAVLKRLDSGSIHNCDYDVYDLSLIAVFIIAFLTMVTFAIIHGVIVYNV